VLWAQQHPQVHHGDEQNAGDDAGHHAGDQEAEVDAFLERLGVEWSGTVHKDVDVWYFPDSEVVYYQASTGSRSVRCVEFEAKGARSTEAALATLKTCERATGFDGAVRSRVSLVIRSSFAFGRAVLIQLPLLGLFTSFLY